MVRICPSSSHLSYYLLWCEISEAFFIRVLARRSITVRWSSSAEELSTMIY